VTERFAADWLAQREPFDHAARSEALARRFAEYLPARPHLVDLAGGTGSMFRFLAPIIGRGQDWTLIDADAALLDDAFGRTAAWARRRGFAATAHADELLLSTPRGLWRLRTERRDLVAPASKVALQAADALVCTALLDLVSRTWLSRLLAKRRVPFLAGLTVDGRDVWRPAHPYDALVRAAFRSDMRRDKGFGRALGIDALPALAGRITASAPSDWRIPRSALAMQHALIDGTADAARRARPAHAAAITGWQEARLRQAMRGRLAITIGHRDILIMPQGPPPGG
jgi:hypothetical protein